MTQNKVPDAQKPKPERIGSQPYYFNNYWSFSDLALHPFWKEALASNNTELMDTILYENGADIEYGWEFELGECASRISQRPCLGRVVFKERTDAYHMKNYMSVEDLILHEEDTQMRIDMIEIRNQTTSLQAASEERLSLYSESSRKVKEKEVEKEIIVLSDEEFDNFVESLDDDDTPNLELQALNNRSNRWDNKENENEEN